MAFSPARRRKSRRIHRKRFIPLVEMLEQRTLLAQSVLDLTIQEDFAVRGTVYFDRNANGVQDPGPDFPYPQVRVYADADGNSAYDPQIDVNSTATDAQGAYTLESVS